MDNDTNNFNALKGFWLFLLIMAGLVYYVAHDALTCLAAALSVVSLLVFRIVIDGMLEPQR